MSEKIDGFNLVEDGLPAVGQRVRVLVALEADVMRTRHTSGWTPAHNPPVFAWLDEEGHTYKMMCGEDITHWKLVETA